jgi:hypothetical protein
MVQYHCNDRSPEFYEGQVCGAGKTDQLLVSARANFA